MFHSWLVTPVCLFGKISSLFVGYALLENIDRINKWFTIHQLCGHFRV